MRDELLELAAKPGGRIKICTQLLRRISISELLERNPERFEQPVQRLCRSWAAVSSATDNQLNIACCAGVAYLPPN
jgi:hypothetical protein